MTAAQKMTIAQIRRELFINESMYAVIGENEYTNDGARAFLFEIENQDAKMSIIDNGTHFLIY